MITPYLDYNKYFDRGRRNKLKEAYTSHNTNRLNVDEIIYKIKKLQSFNYLDYV